MQRALRVITKCSDVIIHSLSSQTIGQYLKSGLWQLRLPPISFRIHYPLTALYHTTLHKYHLLNHKWIVLWELRRRKTTNADDGDGVGIWSVGVPSNVAVRPKWFYRTWRGKWTRGTSRHEMTWKEARRNEAGRGEKREVEEEHTKNWTATLAFHLTPNWRWVSRV
jgi:hypothetical protein